MKSTLALCDLLTVTLSIGLPSATAQAPKGVLILDPAGFTNNQFEFHATGPTGTTFQVQVSTNLLDWAPLLSVSPFGGNYDFVDSNSSGFSNRFYQGFVSLPPVTSHYSGNSLVLVGHVPTGFGAGAVLYFDLNGDGIFEQQVTADANGLYTIALDTSSLAGSANISSYISSADGSLTGPITTETIQRDSAVSPTEEVPVNLVKDDFNLPVEPDICACESCREQAKSLLRYANSLTPSDPATELATGKLRWSFPVVAFDTRMLGFDFQLTHASLVKYAGAVGPGFSHSYNMMVVQDGATAGQIVTPDLRVYDIASGDGLNWSLPEGFYSTLTLNTNLHRWTLTDYSGHKVEFYQGNAGRPGYPVAMSDPNGNVTSLAYDASGFLQAITTDLGQTETLSYGTNGMLAALTDHLGRTWNFLRDSSNRLTQVTTPATQYAAIAAGTEVTDINLAGFLVTRPRTTTIGFTNSQHPFHITSVTDDRGAVPLAWTYDAQGRVSTNFINGKPEIHVYSPSANPMPLPRLEPMNLISRVVDREGNVIDYEIHSRASGPLGGAGQFGLRRKVTWTETGKGNPALRTNEPAYYEERLLQDCDCLSPHIVVQFFSSLDAPGLVFDTNGIPTNWPRTIYDYNANRQVTSELYTDGAHSIQVASTYQPSGFGVSNQFSRLATRTDPRAFDTNPVYAGLNFVHGYQYDSRGNQTLHNSPTVTRGVGSPQVVFESWTYNEYGQKLTYTDPNGEITVYGYYGGASAGGDINTKGAFGGYLATVTRGATGSTDLAVNLTTTHRVNALGLVTEVIDPKGYIYDYEFNNLGESVHVIEPQVTLRNSQLVRYDTWTYYDGAGNAVMISRTNLDFDGTVLPNATVDRSLTYDAVNNRLSERVEVDANHADDLITSYAYNANDLRSIVRKREGNREFKLYDERRLPFKTFYGVAPGVQIDSGYPASKQAITLGATTFVGYQQENYDSRRNPVQTRDGRGYVTYRFYDFRNRLTALSDPNGNGQTTDYDAASEALTIQDGAVSPTTGAITQVLGRSYQRFDESARQYARILDNDLANNESTLVDPSAAGNSSYQSSFDAGSRLRTSYDANGNPTIHTYDAANRELAETDALGNSVQSRYDANGNVTNLSRVDVAGPGASGAPETYVTTRIYDQLNRQTEEHILGLNGDSIDHHTFFALDSRGDVRLVQDAMDNFALTTFDDQKRPTRIQRFDGDPTSGTPKELSRTESVFDRNSRRIEAHAFSSVTNLASIQNTRYAFDDLDRIVRVVYPDSDDPIDGSSNGTDGIYDRVETTYDPNSNTILVKDQRGVVFTNTYDPGNRLISQNLALPISVRGLTVQAFGYDARNRITNAMNDFSKITRSYDALSRMTNETESIKLDGSGFTTGWEQPVTVAYTYDLQSNNTNCLVLAGTNTDLVVSRQMDALNRIRNIQARYFHLASSNLATYAWFGPARIQTKTLGNGARMTNSFDVKRRLSSLVWLTPTNSTLVGFQYAYDNLDNPLYERWLHDNGDYDYYKYDHRYELTGAEYRSTNAMPPGAFGTTFTYDDNLNRTQASFGGPFAAQPNTLDNYAVDAANEYTQLTRNGVPANPANDLAGNMTRLPVLPVSGVTGQQDVNAAAVWDAFDCLFSIDTGATPVQNYRYDPFCRRIATLSGLGTTPERRFIYDDWTTVEERLFDGGATPANAPSTLERIYVDGGQIDDHLLTAIDRNGDGVLDPVNLNRTDVSADQHYYFLPNRLGTVTALLAADNPNRTLEYYRYTATGEASVLPIVDNNNDGLEDTPLDLSDNFAQGFEASSSEHGNEFLYTGQRFDDASGLYYYRSRLYETRSGRFVSRDPVGYQQGMNLNSYVKNRPTVLADPLGLRSKCSWTASIEYQYDNSGFPWGAGPDNWSVGTAGVRFSWECINGEPKNFQPTDASQPQRGIERSMFNPATYYDDLMRTPTSGPRAEIGSPGEHVCANGKPGLQVFVNFVVDDNPGGATVGVSTPGGAHFVGYTFTNPGEGIAFKVWFNFCCCCGGNEDNASVTHDDPVITYNPPEKNRFSIRRRWISAEDCISCK